MKNESRGGIKEDKTGNEDAVKSSKPQTEMPRRTTKSAPSLVRSAHVIGNYVRELHNSKWLIFICPSRRASDLFGFRSLVANSTLEGTTDQHLGYPPTFAFLGMRLVLVRPYACQFHTELCKKSNQAYAVRTWA